MGAREFLYRMSSASRFFGLDKRKTLIVGGSGGIGSECALLLSELGADVGITYLHSRGKLSSVRATGDGPGSKMRAWRLDVRSSNSRDDFVHRIRRDFAPIDAIALCHGRITGKRLTEQTDQEIERQLQVNLVGTVQLTKRLVPLLANQSALVVLTSTSAFAGSYDPVYAASKGALVSFVKSMARELGPRTRVNAVAPGLVVGTGMFESMPELVAQRHKKSNLLSRLATPRDVATTVAFLLSPASFHITGACVDVNGGEYLR